VQPARRHGHADRHRYGDIGGADQPEQDGRAGPEFLQDGEDDRACDHERGIEHVDGGDNAGATIGAGPDLYRREHRHDE